MCAALSSDLEVMKDIPGYKAILKSVLKTQIQLLIEQLADHTGEESIILTASVNDGTLSHLGSSTGKGFLDGRDEIKSQFLGFCLKSHHKKKTQEVKSPYQRVNHGNQSARNISQHSPVAKRPRVHPVGLQHSSSNEGLSNLSSLRNDSITHGISTNITPSVESSVKLEAGSEQSDIQTESPNFSSTQNFPSSLQLSHTQTSADTEFSESGQTQNTVRQSADESNDSNNATSIKIEPITENEMELEITGVEPGSGSDNWGQGYPQGQSSEGDESQGQPGDPAGYNHYSSAASFFHHGENEFGQIQVPTSLFKGENQFQVPRLQSPNVNYHHRDGSIKHVPYESGYGHPALTLQKNVHIPNGDEKPSSNPLNTSVEGLSANYMSYNLELKVYTCQICGKFVRQRCDLVRHIRKHTGERPFKCNICGRGFSRNESLNIHKFTKHMANVPGNSDVGVASQK